MHFFHEGYTDQHKTNHCMRNGKPSSRVIPASINERLQYRATSLVSRARQPKSNHSSHQTCMVSTRFSSFIIPGVVINKMEDARIDTQTVLRYLKNLLDCMSKINFTCIPRPRYETGKLRSPWLSSYYLRPHTQTFAHCCYLEGYI